MHFIDIWVGSLTADPAKIDRYLPLLSREEQDKTGSFKNPVMQQNYVLVRGILRTLLADYLHLPPDTLTFTLGEHGKPRLLGHSLAFNLSHSANTLAIAVSDLENIGVDIEEIKLRKGLSDIAERCFSPLELAYLSQLPEPDQVHMFYKLWTRKEAFVKAVGRGISLGLAECEVNLPHELSFKHIPNNYGSADDWKIVELSLTAELYGALVAPNAKFTLQQRQLA